MLTSARSRGLLSFGFVALATLALGCDNAPHAVPFEPTDGDSGETDENPSEGGIPIDAEWEMVFEDREQALFSVWGTTGDDVWVVGADAGDGPIVMHYDGDAWEVKETGATGDLWWVSGRGDDVWMSGAEGLVLRYSVSNDEFEEFRMPDEATMYGIFPVAEDDVWTVGGGFVMGPSRAIYRFDGNDWNEVEVPEASDGNVQPFFKVWGRGSDDLWVVGFGSEALHRVGSEWEAVEVPTGQRLFTVHGNDDYVAAVGGTLDGLLVEEDDGAFVNATPEDMPQMNGVWVDENGDAIAGGVFGYIYERTDGEWREVLDIPDTPRDYHAVFVDQDGGQWAVGGVVVAPPYVAGMLAHRGAPVSSDGVPD